MSHDLEVYRDQLGEIDRDAARGLIGAAEAEQARAEIGRRILRLAETRRQTAPQPAFAGAAVGMAAVLSVPLVSWGLYACSARPTFPRSRCRHGWRTIRPKARSTNWSRAPRRILPPTPRTAAAGTCWRRSISASAATHDAVIAYRKAIALDGATANREAGSARRSP